MLQSLPKAIIPNLVNPLMLCDFLTDSFSVGMRLIRCHFAALISDVQFGVAGGVVSLMALDGLWTLMQKHGLDYPDFYSKLYSLLTLETLHAEYRTDFFKKLDMFLSSGYLASYIAAAFAKRYSS